MKFWRRGKILEKEKKNIGRMRNLLDKREIVDSLAKLISTTKDRNKNKKWLKRERSKERLDED